VILRGSFGRREPKKRERKIARSPEKEALLIFYISIEISEGERFMQFQRDAI